MEILCIIIGLLGLGIGYGLGFIMAKQRASQLEQQLESSRDKLSSLKQEATRAIEAERAKIKGAAQQIEEAGKYRQAYEQYKQQFEAQRTQLEQIHASLQEVEAARAKAVELAEAHKQTRLQAEGRMKQAEMLAGQSRQEVHQLEAQVQQLIAEKNRFREQAAQQGKRLQTSAPAAAESAASPIEAFGDSGGSLEGVLQVLLEQEGQSAAVLADANGIVVSAVGDNSLKDGIAATSRLVDSLVKQLDGMVPFTSLRSYCFQDEASNVLTGRAFACAGETVGLATYGPREPAGRIMDGAMANLSAILE
jgi:myosin heavy subunit